MSIFKMRQFQNIHFVGDLIPSTSCEFDSSDATESIP